MKRGLKITLIVGLLLLVAMSSMAYVAYHEFVGTEEFDDEFYATNSGNSAAFSVDSYAAALGKHVDAAGMVSYASLKAGPSELHTFVRKLAGVDPEVYAAWDTHTQTAFWINAYNALTLKAIIDNHPIEAGLLTGVTYPKNSIRQIPGVWDKLQFLVMGKRMTLNHIEHTILREQFNEPRIHVALVCAAMSCPRLRNEPFIGEKLDAQLDDQSRGFLTGEANFRIDSDNGVVYMSSIFQWFGGDFVRSYAPVEGFGANSKAERAVLHFASKHLAKEQADFLRSGEYSVKYLGYDWSLNEKKN